MAGYTRQSAADIIPTAVVRSAPVNAELNTLRDAFDHDTTGATGHKHDGSSDEGSYVPLIADIDGLNKVVVDTSTNRVSVYTEVAATAVEQIRFEDGVIYPVTTNDIDLGTVSLQFKNAYFDGIVQTDTLTVDINATIAGTLGVTGLSTLPTVDINGGNIDGTVIGSATPAASNFTTLGTSGQAALASVNIDGGTVDGTTVGITVPAAGVFTTLSATTSITGGLTGNVTGNLTGNVTGAVTGNVTGDLTGNVTAATGSSSFNNVTINGSLDMNSGTSATITNLATPVLTSDAATKGYVDTSVSDLIAAAPGTLDTLNELAAALGDDPAFATTVTNSIATKLPLAGGTMSGAIAMGTSKITGMGAPTANQDAATKLYVDTADALKVTKAGDTMSGDLAMGSNKVTGLAAPTLGGDATNKTYVDGILGSATAAADSAAAALVSETNAAADAIATAADKVQTGLDVITTTANAAATAADLLATDADTIATAADRVQTGLDAAATAADLLLTDADTVATAADRVQTGLDAIATAADRVQTGLDVTASAASAAAASTSAADALVYATAAAADFREEGVGSITGTTLDLTTGNVFSHAPATSPTYVFSNPPVTGIAYGFTLKVTPSATVSLTWPASVDWTEGTAPTAPANGETDVFTFYTQDGGIIWYGFQAGDAMA